MSKQNRFVMILLVILICVGTLSGIIYVITYAYVKGGSIAITNEFSSSIVSLSTSFMSIFGLLTLFIYGDVDKRITKHRLEKTNLKISIRPNSETGALSEDHEELLATAKILTGKIDDLEKYRNDSLLYFALSIILITISLGFVLGNQLITALEEDIIWTLGLVFFSVVPMLIGMGLMIFNVARLLITHE